MWHAFSSSLVSKFTVLTLSSEAYITIPVIYNKGTLVQRAMTRPTLHSGPSGLGRPGTHVARVPSCLLSTDCFWGS